jgi:hypothetical protein
MENDCDQCIGKDLEEDEWYLFKSDIPVFNKKKANWIGHIFRRNCLLKYVIEGQIEGRIEVTEEDVSSYWMILRK